MTSYIERWVKTQSLLPEFFDMDVVLKSFDGEPVLSIFLVVLSSDGEDQEEFTREKLDKLSKFLSQTELDRIVDEVCVNFYYRRLR